MSWASWIGEVSVLAFAQLCYLPWEPSSSWSDNQLTFAGLSDVVNMERSWWLKCVEKAQ